MQHLRTQDSANSYAANLYDAVILFALAAGEHLDELSNGALIVAAMRNVSFDGMTGRVQIDQSGDLKESLRAMNYVLEGDGTMHGKQMGVYSTLDRQYSAVQHDVIWPGGSDVVPFAWLSCQVGAYLVQQSRCTPCPPGSASVGGTVTACVQCSAGMRSAAASFGPACRLSRMLDPPWGAASFFL
jgi:hypothetical protein